MVFDEERSSKAGTIDVEIKKRGPASSFIPIFFEVLEDCNPDGALFLLSSPL